MKDREESGINPGGATKEDLERALIAFHKAYTREAKPVIPVSSKEPDRLSGSIDRIRNCLNAQSDEAKPEQSWQVGDKCQTSLGQAEIKAISTKNPNSFCIEYLNGGLNLVCADEIKPIQSEREKKGLALYRVINWDSDITDKNIISSPRFKDYLKAIDAGWKPSK